jgi:hypothetical protein
MRPGIAVVRGTREIADSCRKHLLDRVRVDAVRCRINGALRMYADGFPAIRSGQSGMRRGRISRYNPILWNVGGLHKERRSSRQVNKFSSIQMAPPGEPPVVFIKT